jgi:GNAT superfamily N-acetyltransferase
MQVVRTNFEHADFIHLVKKLDMELAERDGEDHSFYAQFNKIDQIRNVVLIYQNEEPVSCGGIKVFDKRTMEIKRMYTAKENRGQGIASIVLKELEKWAQELAYARCILETGLKQPEAIRLYQKNGYVLISNYGQYAGIENSRCFEKQL